MQTSTSRFVLGFAWVVALGAAGALAGCDKSESTTSTPPTPSASVTAAQPLASAPPAESASAAPTTSAAPEDSAATAEKASPPDAKKDGGGAAAAGSAAPAECGTKPQPDCPLQAWMKANVNPPVQANDMPALAAALDKIVGFAPPGYTNWASIAKDGAAAARNGDMSAAKASCRSCHDQYKAKYKSEMRARKI